VAEAEPGPGLGPYRGPVVVLALIAVIVLGGLLISLVGAVRAPDDVSNSATVLGTFPIDPDAPGIPPGPADGSGETVPGASAPGSSVPSSTTPGSSAPGSSVPGSSTPGTTASSVPAGAPTVVDAFDGDLSAWEPAGGDWTVADGDLVAPEGTDADPAFLLRTGGADETATGIGAEVTAPARAGGLVVAHTGPGTYVAALAVPALGGWRLEVRADGGEVANASVPAPTGAGTTVELVLRAGEAVLRVDGAEVGSIEAPDATAGRVGFVARGPAGARWAAALGVG
jgi:hypothetical protein